METIEYSGKTFYFNETPTLPYLLREIFSDNYCIFRRGVEFADGDIILDIGANEGIFSIMMAKMFPKVRVIALEPIPRTFFQMMRNIGANGVSNVEPYQLGIGKPGEVCQHFNVHNQFSGGSSAVDTFDPVNHSKVTADVISLDEAFKVFKIPRAKLMKMDIEGGEYIALYNSTVLTRVDNFVGEFHINERLKSQGYDINELATFVSSKTNLIHYDSCKMAE